MDILISSTYEDLKVERQAASEAVERIGHAVRMEDFPAINEQSSNECRLRLRECDIVILLIGDRYGSIDPKMNCSVTELEYRTARELDIPVLAFLKVDAEEKWTSYEDDPTRHGLHEAFKRRIDADVTRRTFQTPEELKFEIVTALNLFITRYGLIGTRGSVFQTFKQFFDKYLDNTKILNHTFPIVGRSNYIEQIRSVPDLKQQIILLSGAGGIGKTKILYSGLIEMRNAFPDTNIYFLGEGNTYTPDHAKELPDGKYVIVVDNVHRVTNGLDDLFALVQRHPDRVKMILSTRTYSLPRLRQSLSFAGFDYTEILELPEIHFLTNNEIETLAIEVLGRKSDPLISQLISVSQGSPLITIIAGQLPLDPQLLSQDDSGAFQHYILNRFQDELVGQVSGMISPDLVRDILKVIATLTPLNSENKILIERIAGFLEIKYDKLMNALDILQANGILACWIGMYRIIPDVLSDHILHQACFTSQGKLTGYGKRSIDNFQDLTLPSILQNMAQLDWRVSKGKGTTLLQEVWQNLRNSYQTGNDQDRFKLLTIIASVAYYQPKDSLTFANLVLQLQLYNDVTDPNEDFIKRDILYNLAPILRDIALYHEHTHDAATLLWQIGCDDNRSLSNTSDHSICILQKLASYSRPKPLAYNLILFEWVRNLAYSEGAFGHHYSPLDIIPAFLNREGSDSWSQGRQYNISYFLVDPMKTIELRQQVLTLLQELGQQGSSTVRYSIIRLLVKVICFGLTGLGNFRPDVEHFTAWQDEDRTILSILETLLTIEENPVILLEVEDDLLTVRQDARRVAIINGVTSLIDHLPINLETTMIRYLRQGSIHRRFLREQDDSNTLIEQELSKVLDEFFIHYPTPETIIDELERLFSFLNNAGVQATSSNFILRRMCIYASALMMNVANLFLTRPDSPAITCFPNCLMQLYEEDMQGVLSCLHVAETSSHSKIRTMAAWIIAAPKISANYEEQGMIRRLILDPDQSTSTDAIWALGRFPYDQLTDVIDILEQITIGNNAAVAEHICMLFDMQGGIGIDPQRLPKSFISHVLDQMLTLDDWSQLSHVSGFIDWVTTVHPEHAATFYLARIHNKHLRENAQSSRFVAIPYHLYRKTAQIDENSDIIDTRMHALRQVRNATLKEKQDIWQLTTVFALIAQSYDPSALTVLQEWVDSKDPQKMINSTYLLGQENHDFIFTHLEYVVHLLEVAHQQSESTLQEVQDILVGTLSFVGWVGIGHQEDDLLYQQAIESSQRYPEGHVANSFFQLIGNIIQGRIGRKIQLDDMIEDD